MNANCPTTGELNQAALQEHSRRCVFNPVWAVPSFPPAERPARFRVTLRPGQLHAKKAPVLRPGLKFGDGPPKEGGPTAML